MTTGVPLSARGTRLTARGMETRRSVIEAAIACLASGGPGSVSANNVARSAGVTWGTLQHQFGDADGLWCAVLESILADEETLRMSDTGPPGTIGERVAAVLDLLWRSLDDPRSRAIYHLRRELPHHRAELESSLPRTAQAILRWEREWSRRCQAAFEPFDVDPARIRRVGSFLPGAMQGLRAEHLLVTYADVDLARAGLAEAVTAYLQAP